MTLNFDFRTPKSIDVLKIHTCLSLFILCLCMNSFSWKLSYHITKMWGRTDRQLDQVIIIGLPHLQRWGPHKCNQLADTQQYYAFLFLTERHNYCVTYISIVYLPIQCGLGLSPVFSEERTSRLWSGDDQQGEGLPGELPWRICHLELQPHQFEDLGVLCNDDVLFFVFEDVIH